MRKQNIESREPMVMNKTRLRIFLIAVVTAPLLLLCAPQARANEWSGTLGAEFVRIPIGARQAAMGDASCAAVDDVNSIYWNPAGLAFIDMHEVTFSHAVWFADINYAHLAYAQRASNMGTFAGAISYLFMDPLEGRDKYGNPMSLFDAHSFVFDVSYAKKLPGRVLVGANVKIINENIKGYSATTAATDLGVIFTEWGGMENLTLGVVMKNIGFSQRFISEAYPLPYSTRVGCCYGPLEGLILALDMDIPADHNISLHLGSEYWLSPLFAVRAGYKTSVIADLGPLAGLTCGLGLKWEIPGFNYRFLEMEALSSLHKFGLKWQLDYAFVPYGDLGYTHRISLTAKF